MKQLMKFSEQLTNQKEYQFARVLVVIVLVFLACHIPRLCLLAWDTKGIGPSTYKGYLLLISGFQMNNLFLTIDSSVNVLIYGCLNDKFRSVMFCRRDKAINTENNVEIIDMATQMVELQLHVQED